MKIAIVNKHYQLGGIETVVHQLWRGLPRLGFESELWVAEFGKLAPKKPVHLLYPPLLNRLQLSRFQNVTERFFPRRIWTAREFEKIRQSDCDVVHVHGFDETYASFDLLVELAKTKPMALTLHGAWPFTGGCGQPLGCERFTDACGKCPQVGVSPVPNVDNSAAELEKKRRLLGDAPIHFVSPSLHLRSKALRSTPGRKWEITHIPNGVNTAFFHGTRKNDGAARRALGVEPQCTVVLAMCRDFRDPVKGSSLMVGALQLLDADKIQVVLLGESGEQIASQIPSRLRPTPLGYVGGDTAKRDLLEIADIFLFTSLEETFPCVVLEAMSAECCVVSTPLAAVREQLESGVSGFVAAKFTAESIAHELARICNDPVLRREVARCARDVVVERFSEEVMISQHAELYRRISR
jgi:glycosyltransferase involved in cell wall biosynthesis